ncbi:hypothetical protein QQF64_034060 [Cirrhinus molitorella]|uniref:Uncharacterized protein n=1 Tax=Cirrhinus molitorella TaxID=172907 RepID=A0ABR3MVN9_9TELE
MQLVLLCREEDFRFFGQEKIFSPLVADLKDIEELGFETKDGSNLKGALIAISGDNLGSHCIGGFTENFSRSIYFCRYCLIDRDTFQKKLKRVYLGATARCSFSIAVSISYLTISFPNLPQCPPNWITTFHVPWEKMAPTLQQAISTEKRAAHSDRLEMIRVIVDTIRMQCPNPTRAECSQIAKNIVAQYPKTFADVTDEEELLGSGYTSL